MCKVNTSILEMKAHIREIRPCLQRECRQNVQVKLIISKMKAHWRCKACKGASFGNFFRNEGAAAQYKACWGE